MTLFPRGATGRSLLAVSVLTLLTAGSALGSSFISTSPMSSGRAYHTTTLLPNGKVLVAGGFDGSQGITAAELFDPAVGTFTPVGPMNAGRYEHTATLLSNGKVLIAGGVTYSPVNSAELFDPATLAFTLLPNTMNSPRKRHTATLLRDGRVLVAGGYTGSAYLDGAEIYNPATGVFTPTAATMHSTRAFHTATLLPNGKVLIAGGVDANNVVNATEVFDVATGFTSTASMAFRYEHTATLLPSGKVLMAGGIDENSVRVSSAQLYDPVLNTFSPTGAMRDGRSDHTATLLPNGKVLVTGGNKSGAASIQTADLYDPSLGAFSAAPDMNEPRAGHAATLLPGGAVLVTGSITPAFTFTNTAEIYDPSAPSVTQPANTMQVPRAGHSATLLQNGTVLVAGGSAGLTAETFDPQAGAFTFTAGPMRVRRVNHTATLLTDGRVLITGGHDGNYNGLNSPELYDPAPSARTFAATGNMSTPRAFHSATLLSNGNVLIAGGQSDPYNSSVSLGTAEIFDVATGTFVRTSGDMITPRQHHAAALLPNGKVFLTGGLHYDGIGSTELDTAELYDPVSDTFSAVASTMVNTRWDVRATLLPNGNVLIAGGRYGATGYRISADLYAPQQGATGTFISTGNMTVARSDYAATVLPNGSVLVTGGYSAYISPPVASTEIYDPARGTFSASATLNTARAEQTSTLLPNGKVLIAGGSGQSALLNSFELFDTGYGVADIRRPVISSLTNPVCQPVNLGLGGSRFTGDSEGSGGTSNSSAGNEPLLRLQRIDNGRFLFGTPQTMSASSYFSATLVHFASGFYRAAIVSNALSSVERIIDIETTPLVGTYNPITLDDGGSAVITPSSLPVGYDGAFYPVSVSVPNGFTGTLRINGVTGEVVVNNAAPPGSYIVTVSAANACDLVSSKFTLSVIGPPAYVIATGGTPQSTLFGTPFGQSLQAKVTDSGGNPLSNVGVNFVAPASGASASLSDGGAAFTDASGVATITATANGIAGNYNVTAIVGGLSATLKLSNRPGAPTSVGAIATAATTVRVTWNSGAQATMHQILRSSDGVNFTSVGSSAASPFDDTNATGSTAYLYLVRASVPALSSDSPRDLATTVMSTTQNVASGGAVTAADIGDLRIAINAVRAMKVLGDYAFTDALTAQATRIKALHLNQLRTALGEARLALNLPPAGYSNALITAGTSLISATDVNDLRNGVK